jgi:hypothetical protein
MKRENKLLLILLVLFLLPFISTKRLLRISEKYTDDKTLEGKLSEFRKRPYNILVLIIPVLIASFILAHCFANFKISRISGMQIIQIISTVLLSLSVFGRLGWNIQTWSGNSLIERLDKKWFQITYSFGILLFFISVFVT